MKNDNTDAEQKPGGNPLPVRLLEMMREKSERIKAENLRLKGERNARRWKAERDPLEYELQKAAQREAYRNRISIEESREVRAYESVGGKTREERDANARKRDAARKKAERSNLSQVKKDKEADRKWARRQTSAGKTAEEIEAGLEKRRTARRNSPIPYSDNPNWGAF